MSEIRVLSVASEVYPLIKTGGLADVAGALPAALAVEGVLVRTLIPGYPAVIAACNETEVVYEFADLFGGSARLLAARAGALDLFVLDAPHLFDRPGNPYLAPNGRDWPDNAIRFAALARVGALVAKGLVPGFSPDIVHLHDWQAALTPVYLRYDGGPRPGCVMTIHNIAYQGQFGADLLPRLGLPPEAYGVDGIEYYGTIGYLKGGLQFADRITTVSPTYAEEICTPEFGMGLDGLLRSRANVLSGILNGIDEAMWDPSRDTQIASTFSRSRLDIRLLNRLALQRKLGMAMDSKSLLLGVVSRLTWQKGLDMLHAALPTFLQRDVQLALLGAGDQELESAYRELAARFPGRVGCYIGYDESLAHLVQAGCDALVVPSRFEPCGLTQLYALRYGALPIVARVGGLADTVIDANEMALASHAGTGIQFSPPTSERLTGALRRALALFAHKPTWKSLQLNAMAADVSWRRPAQRYAALYRDLISTR